MIVVWRVTDSCNLSCPFCAFDKRLGFARREADLAAVLRVATALADYQNLTGQPVLLSWLGGEPLLWKPLKGLTKAVRALGLEVSATTNGTTLGSPTMRRHLCDTYKELTISVDGFSNLHDPMRGWSGGFEKLRRWVPALAAEAKASGSPLQLRANIVLMHQTVEAFPALCEELASWGIAELTFNQLGGRDRPEFYPAHRLTLPDVRTLEAQLPRLRSRLAASGTTLIGGDKYLDRIRASAMDEPNPVEDCSPGESFLFIDERGRIAPCSFTNEDYAVSIDDITSALDIAALPFRFQQLRQARRSNQCNDCLSTQVCDKFKPVPAGRQAAYGLEAAQ